MLLRLSVRSLTNLNERSKAIDASKIEDEQFERSEVQYRCNNNNFSDNQFNAAPPASISFPHSSSSASLNFNNQKRSLNLIPKKLLPFAGGGRDGRAGIGRGGGNGGGGGDGNSSGDDSSC
ncbi:hypothetical protein SO802_032227 [Lithocarpus litseifolius]|uniref:Uncharacterized protein n=1 Tax=Lithocarpus litseifolius TaxID=425828 RepID=A0AAW2BMU2_9ROSI